MRTQGREESLRKSYKYEYTNGSCIYLFVRIGKYKIIMSYYANNKYEQEPEFELDLHGWTTMEAKEELDEIIREGDYSHIRVIVGKGKNSADGPVLPNFVKNYLNERNIRFSQSKIQDGGEGALEVYF